MRRLGWILVLSLAAGCSVHSSPPPQERPRPVEDTHTCIGACDHFFVDGGWVIEPGHKHGPACGHVLVDGRWKKQKGGDTPKPAEPENKDK